MFAWLLRGVFFCGAWSVVGESASERRTGGSAADATCGGVAGVRSPVLGTGAWRLGRCARSVLITPLSSGIGR